MREGDRRKEILKERIETFRKDNGIETKCMGDQTLLYIRYIIARIETRNAPLPEGFKKIVMEVYQATRGNMNEINVLVPSSLALGIIGHAVKVYYAESRKRILTQREISWILGIEGDTRIRTACQRLQVYFESKGIGFT